MNSKAFEYLSKMPHFSFLPEEEIQRVAENAIVKNYSKGVLKQPQYEELEKAYSFLQQTRFARQVTAIMEENGQPDNYINPKKLTRIEQKMLKEIFTRVEKFQSRLEIDFIGRAWHRRKNDPKF